MVGGLVKKTTKLELRLDLKSQHAARCGIFLSIATASSGGAGLEDGCRVNYLAVAVLTHARAAHVKKRVLVCVCVSVC